MFCLDDNAPIDVIVPFFASDLRDGSLYSMISPSWRNVFRFSVVLPLLLLLLLLSPRSPAVSPDEGEAKFHVSEHE